MILEGLVLVFAGVPAPAAPICPWAAGEVTVLLPGLPSVPLNASIWIRSYASGDVYSLSEPTGYVDLDRLDTDLTSTPNTLIELRPRELLEPSTEYDLYRTEFGALGTF